MKRFIHYILNNFKNNNLSLENILVRYSVIIFIICVTYAFFWIEIAYYPPAIINCILAVAFMLILYFSFEKVQTEFLLQVMLLLATFLIFILSILTWNTTPTITGWFTVLPFFAMLTLPKRKALYWSLAAFLLLLITYPVHKLLNNYTSICIQNPFNILFNIFQIIGVFIFSYIVGGQYLKLRDAKQKDIEIKNEDLKNIQLKLELTQKYKDVFFANISHEIRTPLNAIKGVSDLLKLDQSETNNQLVKTLKASTSHLMLLINNVLEISKLGEGKIELVKEVFNLEEIITTAFNILKFETQKKGIDYIINVSKNVPNYVVGDKQRLTQILVNILGNAIKFTKEGSVILNVSSKSVSEKFNNEKIVEIIFEIIDTGIGIKAESINNLFKEYYQADASIAQNFGGTGLGLNISKKLVELHNGTINCESEYGKGTNIKINIPYILEENNYFNDNEIIDPIDYSFIDNFSILIVDDNEANLLIEKMIFKNINKTLLLETAENGAEAVEITKSQKFDLILMDMQMPILDGVDATKIIVADENNINNNTPIFGLTADNSTDSFNKCVQAGMKTVVTKPFELNNIINQIIKYCKRK